MTVKSLLWAFPVFPPCSPGQTAPAHQGMQAAPGHHGNAILPVEIKWFFLPQVPEFWLTRVSLMISNKK